MAQPPPLQLAAEGTTAVPRTYFFQNQWVLYGSVDDPRRVPTLDQVGCAPRGDLTPPQQPADMTVFGSRVVDGVSISAIALLGRSGDGAAVECDGATDHGPLWLMSSSEAPPFTPSAIAILGIVLLVAGSLVHPATVELPSRLRHRSSRSD